MDGTYLFLLFYELVDDLSLPLEGVRFRDIISFRLTSLSPWPVR